MHHSQLVTPLKDELVECNLTSNHEGLQFVGRWAVAVFCVTLIGCQTVLPPTADQPTSVPSVSVRTVRPTIEIPASPQTPTATPTSKPAPTGTPTPPVTQVPAAEGVLIVAGGTDQGYAIVELDLETQQVEDVFRTDGLIGEVTWSPSFSALFFTSDYRATHGIMQVYRQDLGAILPTRLTNEQAFHGNLSVSTTRGAIAFVVDRAQAGAPRNDIEEISLSNGARRMILSTPWFPVGLSWAPTGDRLALIAYDGDEMRERHLFNLDANVGTATRVIDSPVSSDILAWLEATDALVFQPFENDGCGIYSQAEGHTTPHQLAELDSCASAVAVSPDGSRIAIGNSRQVTVVNVGDKSVVARIPIYNQLLERVAIAWSPDSQSLAFSGRLSEDVPLDLLTYSLAAPDALPASLGFTALDTINALFWR